MQIYLLEINPKHPDAYDYDCTAGMVIRAKSPRAARKLAVGPREGEPYDSHYYGLEGRTVWTDPKKSTCKRIGTGSYTQPAGVILVDFRAG